MRRGRGRGSRVRASATVPASTLAAMVLPKPQPGPEVASLHVDASSSHAPRGSWIASLASEPLHAGTAQPLVPRIEGVLANAVGASFPVFFARTFQEGAGFRLTSLRRRALSSPLAGRRRCHTGRPSPVSATDERGQSPQPERRP